MRHLVKQIIISFLAITAVAYFSRSIDYQDDLRILCSAAIILSLLNTLIKPLLKIIWLPINVITLGLLGWMVNVIILYLVTLLVNGFTIVPFTLQLGQLSLSISTLLAYIAVAFMINLVSSLVAKVVD